MKTILSTLLLTVFSLSMMAQSSANLKLNLERNKTYRVKSSSVNDQKMKIQGMEQANEITNIVYFSIKTLSAGADFFMAQIRFDTIKNSTSVPKMEMSSANPGKMKSSDVKEITECFLNRLSNSTFVVKMDYDGHVLDIANYLVVSKVLLADIDSIQGAMAANIKPRFEKMAEKEALKGMIESITVYLPNKEVKKGDKWETGFKNSAGGFGMLINYAAQLDDLQSNEANISADVTVEPVNDKPVIMNGAEITSELRGLGKSEMKLDSKTGWIISGSSKMQLSGNMNVKAPGQDMQIPMEISINSEIMAIE